MLIRAQMNTTYLQIHVGCLTNKGAVATNVHGCLQAVLFIMRPMY